MTRPFEFGLGTLRFSPVLVVTKRMILHDPSGTSQVSEPSGLPTGATKADVLKAVRNHLLKQAVLMGTYQR